MLRRLKNASAVAVFDVLCGEFYLFIYTQNALSSLISAQQSCLLCPTVSDLYWLNMLLSSLYRQRNSLHLHNVSFSLLPWGCVGGNYRRGPPAKGYTFSPNNFFWLHIKTPLALSIHCADVTDQRKELSHDCR